MSSDILHLVLEGRDENTNLKMKNKDDLLMKKRYFLHHFTVKGKFAELSILRWMETVCSTFQDLQFDGSLEPLFIV